MLSECSESIGSETDNHRNGDPLPSPLSPTMSTVSPVSELMNDEETVSARDDKQKVAADNNNTDEPPISTLMNDEEKYLPGDDKQKVSADDDKKLNEPKHINNDVIYDYLPQDYTLTELDDCAHLVIEEASEKDLLVKIDDIYIYVYQRELACLLDHSKWLDDDVLGAYICCIKTKIRIILKYILRILFILDC